MAWLFLGLAILVEVAAALSLRAARTGRKTWYAAVTAGYLLAFALLAAALGQGMALGIAYGIWAAMGVALTAVAGRLLFREPLTWVMALGIAFVMGGVLLVETGSVG
ncbi:DMT family transporter [Saccharopolyspora taberi]|uniref:SMR family transporter n=1 Tax=Saccharopolyspora taberi TaxID=60895 RepID=A0ABN3VKQ5_9PSEU